MEEFVERPVSEGGIRIKRMTPEEDYEGQLSALWEEVRPLLTHDSQTPPVVLMSMVCGLSGRVAQHLSKEEVQEARELILAQISYAVRALRQLPKPN